MNDARAIADRYFSAMGRGDADGVLEVLAPGADFRFPGGAMPVPDGVRPFVAGWSEAFPGNRFEIDRAVVAGDDLVVEGTWVGTHRGPMRLPDGSSIAATGKTVRVPFATVFRVRDGRIASHHAYWDNAGMMAQLR